MKNMTFRVCSFVGALLLSIAVQATEQAFDTQPITYTARLKEAGLSCLKGAGLGALVGLLGAKIMHETFVGDPEDRRNMLKYATVAGAVLPLAGGAVLKIAQPVVKLVDDIIVHAHAAIQTPEEAKAFGRATAWSVVMVASSAVAGVALFQSIAVFRNARNYEAATQNGVLVGVSIPVIIAAATIAAISAKKAWVNMHQAFSMQDVVKNA